MDGVSRITRPRRWDQPFAPDMGDTEIERALALPLLESVDPKQFPPARALAEIIRNDARIVRCRRGEFVMREGDYGNSVFFILRGSVCVVIDRLSNRELGPMRKRRGGALGALGRLLRNPREPEVRDLASYRDAALRVRGRDTEARSFLADPDAIRSSRRIVELGTGEIFGEIAALSRTPRTATVFVDEDGTELLELRWQGLREIRKRDEGFREWIDRLYKERSLATHLAESPLFAGLDEERLQSIAGQTLFEQHGESEWHTTFSRTRGSVSDTIALEPPIVRRDHYLDGLILVRAGLARVTGRYRQTLDCITTNAVFGLEEILHHSHRGGDLVWNRGLQAIDCVDILRVPTHVIETQVLPLVSPELLAATARQRTAPARAGMDSVSQITQATLDFLVDSRVVNGRSTMLIDTTRCTDCDDCVRACAAGHDNNPRFRRHGTSHGDLMVAHACMHCVDPVCLIGCPTGAIHRKPDGQVVIDDMVCIGCGLCARSCPYDNISLVTIRDREGALILDEENRPIIKATKCDLCLDLPGGPACQRACPHDALIRIDASDHATLHDWMNRR